MSRIQQLNASVINKIAAGEVIERPANVVKEFMENSLDALATRIEVDVAKGGTELIRVVDNGQGIHPDDILLAISSHATSKIKTADDLFQVRTMGFRGEALASIGEVSCLRIRSRQPDAEIGVELNVNCGRVNEPTPCGCPHGTLVEISQLFGNTPVRRKFMKSVATEFGHISEQFTRVALANPRLHMVLRHNGKVVHDLPSTHRLIDRLQLFHGNRIAEKLIWVESEAENIHFSGYVAHPSESKSTRKGQYLFLNGRWIQDRTLQHALSEAYRGLLMVGRQPIAYLFLDLAADLVDVNVHPTKVEVRFRDSQQLYRQLLSMLRTKFLSMDLNSEMNVSSPAEQVPGHVETPAAFSSRPAPVQATLSEWPTNQVGGATAQPAPFSPYPMPFGSSEHSVAKNAPSTGNDNATVAEFNSSNDHSVGLSASPHDQGETASFQSAFPGVEIRKDSASVEAPTAQFDDVTGPQHHMSGTSVRAMQIRDCYLVVETDEGLAIIDQHALHERILYEYMRPRALEGTIESQRMLVPEPIELSPRETLLLVENTELLGQFGFGIEEFGHNTVLLTRYPVMLSNSNLVQLVRDIAEQLDGPRKPTKRDLLDELLHMMSCKAAIKSGHRLSPEEIESLLAQRHLIDDAHHCPHGRPTALMLSQHELDRQFGRLG